MNTIEKDQKYIAHAYHRYPVCFVSGKGSILTDEDGKTGIQTLTDYLRDNWKLDIDYYATIDLASVRDIKHRRGVRPSARGGGFAAPEGVASCLRRLMNGYPCA